MSFFGHHHHHHHNTEVAPPQQQQHTVRIYTKAQEDYSLTIRNGEVVLAPANPRDEYQVLSLNLCFNSPFYVRFVFLVCFTVRNEGP